MELAERKEQKQKNLETLERKRNRLMECITDLKKKNQELDLEICKLMEKRAALRDRQEANKVADELDQYKKTFRPERSVQEIPEEQPDNFLERSAGDTADTEQKGLPANVEETAGAGEQADVQSEDVAGEGIGEGDMEDNMTEAVLPANYLISQNELLELIKSISRREQDLAETIVVRNVSAGAKMLEIFHDVTGKFFKVLVMGILMLMLSLAATVLINADLRDLIFEFIRNAGV